MGTGFFWAMGRSADQTLYADYYSKLGYGFGHELRYTAATPSRGNFRTYVFDLTQEGTGGTVDTSKLDYDIDWNALQMLPGKVRATVNVRKYSNLSFQQRFQDNFNYASNRTERWSASLEKDFKLAVLSAYADTTSTYFGTDYTPRQRPAPGVSLRRFPRQVGFGGIVFGLEATADRIRYGDGDTASTPGRATTSPPASRAPSR